MNSPFFRPTILVASLLVFIWYCNGNKPNDDPQPVHDKSQRLIIFCDQEVLSIPALLQYVENDILTFFKSATGPIKIDLYGLDHRTEQAIDLLNICKIDAADAKLLKAGSWKMKNKIQQRCAEAFDKIQKPSNLGCNKIISSLHVLNQLLHSIDSDTDLRVIYYSNWVEMDANADFDQHQYRLRGNNPIGGIYPFERTVLEEMGRQLQDSKSPLRKSAAKLKSTIEAQGLSLTRVHSINGFESKFPDDRDADSQMKLDAFWDSLFEHAGLNRVRVSSIQDAR